VPAVLIDAGPLVALTDRGDRAHGICRNAVKSIRDSLVTVWPAFTEAMYLVRASPEAQQELWESTETGAIEILPLSREDAPRMRELMWKYRDLPMDLADAALVRVAERDRLRRIFTLDKRDFSIYRPSRIGRFLIVP
jgi:predicted nucleic acid-binding protein